jgi:hypothetical protein
VLTNIDDDIRTRKVEYCEVYKSVSRHTGDQASIHAPRRRQHQRVGSLTFVEAGDNTSSASKY